VAEATLKIYPSESMNLILGNSRFEMTQRGEGHGVRNPLWGLSGHGSSLEESEARMGERFRAGESIGWRTLCPFPQKQSRFLNNQDWILYSLTTYCKNLILVIHEFSLRYMQGTRREVVVLHCERLVTKQMP